MKKLWRFIDTGARNAAENMTLDYVLLECKAKDLIPDTIRLLKFKPHSVLVGYHQDVEHEVRLNYAIEKGIDVNRRITGGGAIYFDESSVGWEIIASKNSIPPHKNIEELFEIICKGAVEALKLLGIQASFRLKNDIEVNGRKISGTGGTACENALLFQGTLLVNFDVETMVKVLRIPIIKLKDKELNSIKERITCLKWELGYEPSYKEIKKALKFGFEKAFKIKLENGNLTKEEEKLFYSKLPWFSSENWILLDRRASKEATLVYSIVKKPGGIIQASLALDEDAKLIKSIFITGDFFAFPSQAIYDLESRLKFVLCNEGELKKIIFKFFKETHVEMPGVSPKDILEVILEAIDKASYKKFGFNNEEINHIYPITKNAKNVLLKECSYLLLPYCAKHLNCKYRRIEGCVKCGLCSIGKAYELAEKIGITPVTIQNFEHLMNVLKEMKESGCKGFIGCCCEAFYQKHRDDIEKFGIPGLLIDIDDKTCYELNKQKEAYKGGFEVQTKLKLPILLKIIKLLQKRLINAKA
ncbi:MAG: DUF116 domain-containing protein [Candidatus Bathyarchaeia archaeon]